MSNKNLLALMHDTSGKTNRIKLRVKEFMKEIESHAPELLKRKVTGNDGLPMSFYLEDIKNMAERLDEVLDKFYVHNKHLDV